MALDSLRRYKSVVFPFGLRRYKVWCFHLACVGTKVWCFHLACVGSKCDVSNPTHRDTQRERHKVDFVYLSDIAPGSGPEGGGKKGEQG